MAERGEYRSISRSLLSGKDFRRLPERPRWIFTVLKMNSGMVGLDTWYEAELYSRLAEESGATIDQVRLALDVLEHENWIRREDNVVWVLGHLAHDPHLVASNPKHRKSVQRHVAGLPRIAIVKAFVAQNADWFPKAEAIAMGIGWVWNGSRMVTRKPKPPSDTHSNHDNDTENENENENELPDSDESASKVKSQGNGKYPTLPVEVCDRLFEIWSNTGLITEYPLFRRKMALLYPRYSEADILSGMEGFGECAKMEPPGKAGLWTIHQFVQSIGRWVDWGKMNATDSHGNLTVRGAAAFKAAGL